MTFEDHNDGVRITGNFSTGSAGPIEQIGRLTYRVDPKPETVPQWFYDALQVNFGGAGVPREYAFHIQVTAEKDTSIRVHFRFTETNGSGYMDPPYWIRPEGKSWRPVDEGGVAFEPREHCELSLDLNARVTVAVANKPYVTPEAIKEEMETLNVLHPDLSLAEIGVTAEGRRILALETEPREETILVNATMQPAEPAARPVLAALHALTDRSALSQRLRERFQFCFVPMPNPNGSHHGMSCTNGEGAVPMFSFGRHLDGEQAPEETAAFWRYAEKLRPTGHVEFHTHYQDTRLHKLNPLSTEWFSDATKARAKGTTDYVLGMNDAWRVTELSPDTPIVRAGKFVNLGERFDTIGYCYQIYALTEEATCHLAADAVKRLGEGLAWTVWREEVGVPEIVKG